MQASCNATTLQLPSLAAIWDATNLPGIDGMASLPDLTGNGWDLRFGTVAPTYSSNAFGRGSLKFDGSITAPISTGEVGGGSLFGSSDESDPWAIAVGLQFEGSHHQQSLGEILGDSDNKLSVRITTDDVDFQVRFPGGPPVAGLQNVPISPGSNVVVIVRHDGNQQSIEVISDEASWGSGALSKSIPFLHRDAPLTASAGGNLEFNASQTPINFYGAAYLRNPSDAEVDDLKAWTAGQWLLQGRDQVVLFEGDSTVEVRNSFTDRTPGWAELLHSEYFDATKTLSQNFANGGARAITNDQFGNGLADSPLVETWDYVVEWLSSAGADVYAPLVIGTNDIDDGVAPEAVIAAVEAWAERTVEHGGKPIWIGILDTQGDPIAVGRTAVNEAVRARFLSGENPFFTTFDELQLDPAWGWTNDLNVTAPEFMADETHPNSAGNVDIAEKLAPSFLAILAPPGDFNLDGKVDAADLVAPTDGWLARYGINLFGNDFLDWQQHLQPQFEVSAAEQLPEPGLIAWIVLGVCLTVETRAQRFLQQKVA
ncbi:MAG: SGNH/GDSL hydrolase family protein [Planctomycetota bacterium]